MTLIPLTEKYIGTGRPLSWDPVARPCAEHEESNHRGRLLSWAFCLALLAGTAMVQAALPVQRMALDLAGASFDVEYVAEPDSRRQGLMGRKSLPPRTGMLFDFPEGTRPAIWMRNMVISLDLLYIDGNGEIAQIFRGVPPCRAMPCEIYHATQPLRFVLEVPAGTADSLGLAVGQVLSLGGLPAQPAPRE